MQIKSLQATQSGIEQGIVDSGWMKHKALLLTSRCEQLIKKHEGYISPFVIENRLQHIDGIETGTLMNIAEQLTLVVQTALHEGQLKPLVNSIPYDKIVVVKKIPRDARHHSKIDCKKIKSVILDGQKS